LNLKAIILAATEAYKKRGLFYTLRVGFYTFPFFLLPWYIYYKKIKSTIDSFHFQGQKYQYFYGFRNCTWYNERAVEVSILREAVRLYKGKKILEVGNVLSQYFPINHDILDKYETRKDVIREDIVDFKPKGKYDLIVSVSTLEHVGFDEVPRDDSKIPRALEHMKNMIEPNGGKIIVTLPLGQNPVLDKLLREGNLPFTEQYYLKRISQDNQWKEVSWEDVKDVKYGSPFFAANALIIGIITRC
jgi:hypothetical protein